ncbi:MAG: SUMF1/EgtB/PvdO family nonheme iron enzyme, partial [candidate division Zixibacteria bacterium]|nr:SUMF1/EgtB/PvdO family nonheme iron enzyme [Phycisphaerae bacterium]NIR65217.1 SUMF1/EgtB/PvdO family nonheme iron enzyme [candidate division Zixibacteria bacterium]NIU15105.1 SUMF1/EgtB/PvdO family nonheme iron enzyme [candidate division Zixibacteria bacterium]NIW96991.1 SUMF1/EgtB/PvdO family nonheme iron enzyme [Phycisphaerae bacterium]
PYTSPIGSFHSNGYGLYDMVGNVWDWCNDWYDRDYYDVSPYDNPTGATDGTERVLRPGSWSTTANLCRVACRGYYNPNGTDSSYGFRVVRIPESTVLLNGPNGGESLTSGKVCPIRWSSTGSISDVLIEYSLDNGSSWAGVSPLNVGNNGLYNWLVPRVNSDECLVRVSDASDPNIRDVSDDVFTINLPIDGYIVAWGLNDYGQCDVPDGRDFAEIVSSGFEFSVALRSNGSLAAWGLNSVGQCDVPEGNDFVAIGAGSSHGLAIKTDGSLVAWGSTTYAPTGYDFVAIAGGGYHSLALKADGSLITWGSITDVPDGNDFIAISAGSYNSNLALRA